MPELSEFRIRKHGFASNSGTVGGKLISAEKRGVFYRIKAFFCGNSLCLSKKNNAETEKTDFLRAMFSYEERAIKAPDFLCAKIRPEILRA